jgi:phage baseplate assembly protein W
VDERPALGKEKGIRMQVDFPLRKGSTGYIAVVNDTDSIRGRIISLLNTNPGERVHLCRFGVGLSRYLMEPLDTTTIDDLRATIYEQMRLFEPSLAVLALNIDIVQAIPPAVVRITMEVTELPSNRRYSYVVNAGAPGASALPTASIQNP